MNVLIRAAKILDPENGKLHLKKRDILIKKGLIDTIATNIPTPRNTKELKRPNLHVSVGWFDSGVSFGEPGYEERETVAHGLRVAATSGFTDIVLNPNTHPVPDSSPDIVFLKNAARDQVTNLYPLGALTVGSEGNELAELFDMKKAGAIGFYDFKKSLTHSNLLKIALQYAQNFDGFVHSYPMDAQLAGKGQVNEGIVSTRLGLKGIPALAEELQIVRDLAILEYTGGRLHIPTISSAKSVRLIAEAKNQGLDVSCSVAIHHLWHTDGKLEEFDTNYKTLPPLRTEEDVQALRKGVKEGIVDMVTSDHLPMNIEEKKVEFDNAAFGTLGLESAFGALNKLFGAETAIDLLTRGRRRYRLTPPSLEKGGKACLSLFDPDAEVEFTETDILSTSKNSAFLGERLKGKVFGTINNGTMVFA